MPTEAVCSVRAVKKSNTTLAVPPSTIIVARGAPPTSSMSGTVIITISVVVPVSSCESMAVVIIQLITYIGEIKLLISLTTSVHLPDLRSIEE